MVRKIRIAPSLLASKPEKYVDDVKMLEKANVEWFHIDMLDGTFTSTYAFPAEDLARISAVSDFPMDVHMMTNHPMVGINYNVSRPYLLLRISSEFSYQDRNVPSKVLFETFFNNTEPNWYNSFQETLEKNEINLHIRVRLRPKKK